VRGVFVADFGFCLGTWVPRFVGLGTGGRGRGTMAGRGGAEGFRTGVFCSDCGGLETGAAGGVGEEEGAFCSG
jgi:hypothetical protein